MCWLLYRITTNETLFKMLLSFSRRLMLIAELLQLSERIRTSKTRSKISRSQKFHHYFQILINLWILWWFFIDNTFLTFVMHNFALNKQLLKVLCLKPMKFIKTVLFSFFSALTYKMQKKWQIYISTALLCLSYR